MCIDSYRKDTLKSIKKLNKTLNTHFSYVYCLEEMDLLKLIPAKKETTEKTRNEHLQKVLALFKKGILEDYSYSNKRLDKYDEIDKLFNSFVRSFVNELTYKNFISGFKIDFSFYIDSLDYKVYFNDYDYTIKKSRMEEIDSMIDVIDQFKKTLVHNVSSFAKEEILAKYLKSNYYGPMTLFLGYKEGLKQGTSTTFSGSMNPYNRPKISIFNCAYQSLLNKRKNRIFLDKRDYRLEQLKIQRNRLSLELYRLDNQDNRYDFYFDLFLFRLKNDLEYIYLKQLGGIKKVSELINIYTLDKSKFKELSKGPITVDVDSMTIVDRSKVENKSGGGSQKKKGQIEVNVFDEMEKDRIYRKEQRVKEEKVYTRTK